MDMDPELTEAEVEALNKLVDDVEKLNKQMQRFEESRRLQAESRANKFDRMLDVLEQMVRRSQPEPLFEDRSTQPENPSQISIPAVVACGLDDPCDVEVKPIDSETSSQHLGVKYSPISNNPIKSELTVDASCEEVLKSDLVVDEYSKEDHASLEVNTVVDKSDVVDSVQTQVTFNHLPIEFSLDFVWNKFEVVEEMDGYKLVVPACVQSRSSNFCSQGVCEKVQEISLLHFAMFGELNEGYDILHGAEEVLVIWQHKPPPLPPENVLKNEMLRSLVRRFPGRKLYSLAVLGDFRLDSKKLLKICDEVSPMELTDSQSIVFYKPSNNSDLSFLEEDHSSVLQISGDLSLIVVSKIEAGRRSTTYGLVPTWPDGITKGRIKEELKQFEELCEVKYRFGDYVNRVVIFDRVVEDAYYLVIGECGCTANMDDINDKSVKNLVVQTMCWPFVMVDARFLKPPAKPPDDVVLRDVSCCESSNVSHSLSSHLVRCGCHSWYCSEYWDLGLPLIQRQELLVWTTIRICASIFMMAIEDSLDSYRICCLSSSFISLWLSISRYKRCFSWFYKWMMVDGYCSLPELKKLMETMIAEANLKMIGQTWVGSYFAHSVVEKVSGTTKYNEDDSYLYVILHPVDKQAVWVFNMDKSDDLHEEQWFKSPSCAMSRKLNFCKSDACDSVYQTSFSSSDMLWDLVDHPSTLRHCN